MLSSVKLEPDFQDSPSVSPTNDLVFDPNQVYGPVKFEQVNPLIQFPLLGPCKFPEHLLPPPRQAIVTLPPAPVLVQPEPSPPRPRNPRPTLRRSVPPTPRPLHSGSPRACPYDLRPWRHLKSPMSPPKRLIGHEDAERIAIQNFVTELRHNLGWSASNSELVNYVKNCIKD